MFKKIILPLFSLFFFLLPVSLFAATYDLDPAHSYMGFSVKHMVISNVKGKFNVFSGSFELDGKDDIKSASVQINPATVDTDNEKRDKHLRSPDFFHVEKFPKLSFTFKSTRSRNDANYQVVGDLTIRGVTKEVTLYMEVLGKVTDPWGNKRIGLTGKTEINRKDFGLVWNKFLETGGLVVGDKVKITLEAEGIMKK